MSLNVTVASIIDQARIQDARFFDLRVPDGALLLCVNQTQRLLLLKYGAMIQGLIDQTVQTAAQVSGALVGVDDAGTPYYITTTGNGYPVRNAGTSSVPIPYFDTSLAPVSLDPFGANGGTPGFPLPADLIKLIQVVCVFQDGTTADIDIVPERSRNLTGTHNPTVFINGNRLVPIRNGATGTSTTTTFNDYWNAVYSVSTTYIAMTTVLTTSDVITLPVVLHDALIAAVADLLARATPGMSANDRLMFANTKTQTATAVEMAGVDILGDVEQTSVLFRE